MPKSYNISEIYDEACKLVGDESFTEWISGVEFQPGQLCEAAVWYEETNKWSLEESTFDPRDEENATWYARKIRSGKIPPSGKYVKRYFNLADGEVLLIVNGKYRPVILVRRFESQWVYPGDQTLPTWIVLPLFTYKSKHTQIILEDARLMTPERFYMPVIRSKFPGAAQECAVRYLTVQAVREKYLKAIRLMDSEQGMNRPYRVTQTALKLIMYHLFKNFELFSELTQQKDRYDIFKEYVQELITEGLKTSS